ncbi:hypothetical protein C1645_828272 [Glomus cerebriforme]|uniref:Uncharacterized protein n=1 Tax=Glomus cerebriforme TaxID=658196 RepID=A0A397SSW1_9GLOM|nr:hypothetical protein C1645_828272 [Glomus cerebriforme]
MNIPIEEFKSIEKVLKGLLKDFYNIIIKTNDVNYIEENLNYLIMNLNGFFYYNLFDLFQNHEEREYLFTSLIGYCYQNGIGCKVDKNKALETYLLVVNNKNNKIEEEGGSFKKNLEQLNINEYEFDVLKNINIIIGRYLLSLFYYKDIILDKRK